MGLFLKGLDKNLDNNTVKLGHKMVSTWSKLLHI